MKRRPQCRECGRFVPEDYADYHIVGEGGGPYYWEESLCDQHGGPSPGSNAGAEVFAEAVANAGGDPLGEQA